MAMLWIQPTLLSACVLITGCATVKHEKAKPIKVVQAQAEIPKDQLLDVGIEIFDPGEVTEEAKEGGTYPEIRKAESRFIPYHLKQTLQETAQWGAVRVIPTETDSVDVFVSGEIIASNGHALELRVQVADASGRRWFDKTYAVEADAESYRSAQEGEQDAQQDAYNQIANDILKYRNGLSPVAVRNIRRIAQLRFASNFLPPPANGYLGTDQDGMYIVNRLPAADDPMMIRIEKIRESDYLLGDTLNEYYAEYYDEMWQPYENWRRANQTEAEALNQIRRSARRSWQQRSH